LTRRITEIRISGATVHDYRGLALRGKRFAEGETPGINNARERGRMGRLTDVIRRAEDLPDFGALEDHSRDLEVAQLDVAIREGAHHDQILRLQGEKEKLREAEGSRGQLREGRSSSERTETADRSPIRASGLFRASTCRRAVRRRFYRGHNQRDTIGLPRARAR